MQVLLQFRPPAGGKLQGPGALGLPEVVDVAPVRRDRLPGGQLLNKVFHRGDFAGAGRSGHKNVETLLLDPQTEVQGSDRPFLTDNSFQ